MNNTKFCIGYNFDLEGFKELISEYSEHIESVYFPIPKKYLGSGRILDEPPQYRKEILRLMEYCRQQCIKPFMLLNSTIVSENQLNEALTYTYSLYKKGILKDVTVTDPYLMKQIRRIMPDMFIEASTLCRIRTAQEASYFKEIGADRITTDRETIRDLPTLMKISKILPLKVLANEGCIKNCIYRYAHYNMLSAKADDEPLLIFGKRRETRQKRMAEMDQMCVFSVRKHPHKVFSSPFIRPEDLYRYNSVTNIFKLSTRNFDTNRIKTILKAYIEKRYDGNLIDLLNTSYIHEVFEYIDNKALNDTDFFETLAKCDDDCDDCSYCKKLMKKAEVELKGV